ncbi:MAG: aconitate hydratase AcnA [Anaerolineales bacterium]|nr:aconitate hydratase AcnA [Anaerolineales bacterium]
MPVSTKELKTAFGNYRYYDLEQINEIHPGALDRLPFSIRILLEGLLRNLDDPQITEEDIRALTGWQPEIKTRQAMPFKPARVILQDLTGVPAIVDLAAMRSAMARMGKDPGKVNPIIPVDMVIDHSIQVDFFASQDSAIRNSELEFQRNQERYELLKWAQKSFNNFRVVPPARGIVHQINLEYLANVVLTGKKDGELIAYPDTLVGTDSHTPMINGIGVVGWGVGGIEAEAAMLGQVLDMLTPDVIGFRLHGKLQAGVTPTDLTLTIVKLLRDVGVVGKFVEFFGAGLEKITLADRAMIANMSPENGATMTFFPVDNETMDYLRLTGRSDETVALVEAYCKAQHLYRTADTPDPKFSRVIELDISTIEPGVAGPKRPHDWVPLKSLKDTFEKALTAPKMERGFGLSEEEVGRTAKFGANGEATEMGHGSIVIASITSCTNTSNPTVMIGAGLLAKKAVERGLKVPPFVKTSLSPGSRVVTDYLEKAALIDPLAQLGFNVVGYGCMTCIGNSGPLTGEVTKVISENNLVSSAVVSANRNFEGRVHPYAMSNFLTSPILVVAFALAGTVNIDLTREPLGKDQDGKHVYLKDIFPNLKEIKETISQTVGPEIFRERYADIFNGNESWDSIPVTDSIQYDWNFDSTYIQEPPFFINLTPEVQPVSDILGARVLALLGDFITTDHISPAGAIPLESPASLFLQEKGVKPRNFNSFGSRRGNDRVMVRGTFANIRLKNKMVEGVEGGYTRYYPGGEQTDIFSASEKYKANDVPLVIFAGKLYGSGSSRDWAAKGPLLLGVKAVVAESFERIHRSNLVGMGVLPLQFKDGDTVDTYGLIGDEIISILNLADSMTPGVEVSIHVQRTNGETFSFTVISRLDTETDIRYYENGGILHTVLREMGEN